MEGKGNMEFIKNIARKILTDENENYKPLSDDFQKRNIELRGELEKFKIEHADIVSKINSELAEKDAKRIKAEQRAEELEKENEILRKYYDLDKEPSDEIKMKIHIDLEVNRLKEEKMQLIAMYKQPMVIPQPYPVYGFGRGFI